MAKTRRTKLNRSPIHPFGGRNGRPKVYVLEEGDKITTKGIRGRTKVHRIVNEEGKRVTSARLTAEVKQVPAKAVGDRKPKAIFVGRAYTGIARSKVYPYRSKKRGGPEIVINAPGILRRMGRAVKSVLVNDA